MHEGEHLRFEQFTGLASQVLQPGSNGFLAIAQSPRIDELPPVEIFQVREFERLLANHDFLLGEASIAVDQGLSLSSGLIFLGLLLEIFRQFPGLLKQFQRTIFRKFSVRGIQRPGAERDHRRPLSVRSPVQSSGNSS